MNTGSSSGARLSLPDAQDMVMLPGDTVLLTAQTNEWVCVGTVASQIQGVPIDPVLYSLVANNKALVHDGTKLTLKTVREVLTAARTYYVRTDGSDSNTGLANTAGGAFLTIQKAIDVVATLDISTYDVTIQIGNGTYVVSGDGYIRFKRPLGSGGVTIIGNNGTPSNVVVDGGFINGVPGITLTISGIKLIKSSSSATNAFVLQNNSIINATSFEFGTGFTTHMSIDTGATMTASAYSVASATYHAIFALGGILYLAGTITLTGTPAFSIFLYGTRIGACGCDGATFSGSATGQRYYLDTNPVIYRAGTALPGDVAGTASTGGQYV